MHRNIVGCTRANLGVDVDSTAGVRIVDLAGLILQKRLATAQLLKYLLLVDDVSIHDIRALARLVR